LTGIWTATKDGSRGLKKGTAESRRAFQRLPWQCWQWWSTNYTNGNGEQLSKAKDDLISYLAKTRNGSYSGSGGGTDEE